MSAPPNSDGPRGRSTTSPGDWMAAPGNFRARLRPIDSFQRAGAASSRPPDSGSRRLAPRAPPLASVGQRSEQPLEALAVLLVVRRKRQGLARGLHRLRRGGAGARAGPPRTPPPRPAGRGPPGPRTVVSGGGARPLR